jgi:hypothetical protein
MSASLQCEVPENHKKLIKIKVVGAQFGVQ